MIFKDFQEDFMTISNDNGNSPGELVQKARCLCNHLLPYFGELDMESLGIPEIRNYCKVKLAANLKPKTINNHLLVLSRYLSMAREERKLIAPKFPIKQLSLEFEESRFLSREETQRLISSASHEENPLWAVLITVALHTGMRIGELLALDWKDVNLFTRNVHIKVSLCRISGIKPPKNKKTRDATLTDAARNALASLPNHSGRVFDVAYETAIKAIKRIAARANLAGCRWHTLRHTFASLLVMESVPLIVVSRLLGHSSIRITERYTHLMRDKQTDAMAMLAQALGG